MGVERRGPRRTRPALPGCSGPTHGRCRPLTQQLGSFITSRLPEHSVGPTRLFPLLEILRV